ncbi:MAG: response regulator [Verrucomicrobia bacterium]|nr:response regulator [Verrucomicrobiota bacterium]
MSLPAKPRVFIVDDHPVVRGGLRIIAEVDTTLEIIGEAANAAEALLATRELKPDVVLLDVRSPDRSGLEV